MTTPRDGLIAGRGKVARPTNTTGEYKRLVLHLVGARPFGGSSTFADWCESEGRAAPPTGTSSMFIITM